MNIAETFRQLAYIWHVEKTQQKRKYTGEDYTVHTTGVAELYHSYFPNDLVGIAAAHGHDLYEDTKATPNLLTSGALELGCTQMQLVRPVLNTILELTDAYTSTAYPNWNRKERKQAELVRLANARPAAQNIKVCDLIDNTKSIVEHDPDFARVYLDEKAAALAILTKADTRILERAKWQIDEARAALGLTGHPPP